MKENYFLLSNENLLEIYVNKCINAINYNQKRKFKELEKIKFEILKRMNNT